MPELFRPDFAILNAGYRLAADVETVVDTYERENPMPMTITFFDDHSTCRVEVRKGRELVLTYLADTGMFRVWSFERVRPPIIDLPPMTAERNGILLGITFMHTELALM
jgi:hypothetical protein